MEEGEAELPRVEPLANAQPSAAEAEKKALKAQFSPDVRAIKNNYITITPLQYNLTAYPTLNFIDNWLVNAALKH